ncbi:hypothetical protein ACFT30_10435 [Microbacterium ureisolvens]|uniref:hypothetical protein n=1 Tax=Microbacterium ureisolvens TaxID=2781186 RepID=UPI003645B23E
MSGRRAKAKRRAVEVHPLHNHANRIIATAERVLALDLSHIPLTRPIQFYIGWMRAAFDQSRVIATLTAGDLAHAAAPNRRAFAEIALRLLWLRSLEAPSRTKALEQMIAREKELTTGFYETLAEMGIDHDVDLSAMDKVVAEVIDDRALRQQVKAVTDAAKAAPVTAGLYSAWREETQYTHATAHLAVAYALEEPADTLGQGSPPMQHADLSTHHMVCLLVGMLTAELVKDEGVADEAVLPIVFATWDATD